VRAALRTQVATALAELRARDLSDVNVHSARKAIKKARALLRLLRDVLTPSTYRYENETLRESARPLSAARDSRVLIDTLQRIAGKTDGTEALRHALVAEYRRTQRRVTKGPVVATTRRRLAALHRRALRWPLQRGARLLILHSLKRIYRRARRDMEESRFEPTTERLHDWRKQVKYLWHQLQLLQPMRPRYIGKLADQLHKLSDHLGDEHDLAVLHEKIASHHRSIGGQATRALLADIDKRRQTLRRKAWRVGSEVFADRPSAFAARVSKG
jgi:CHAD domain-containing protein